MKIRGLLVLFCSVVLLAFMGCMNSKSSQGETCDVKISTKMRQNSIKRASSSILVKSGRVSLRRDSIVKYYDLVIEGSKGSVDVPGVLKGNWIIEVDLYDENDDTIYYGLGSFNVDGNDVKEVVVEVSRQLVNSSFEIDLPVEQGDVAIEEMTFANRLDSQFDIENSLRGLDGIYNGGEFVEGKYGNGIKINCGENSQVLFPKNVIPYEKGTIEFWAKIENFPDDLAAGDKPHLINFDDGYSRFSVALNGNDGAGNSGVCIKAGHGYFAGTSSFVQTYEEAIGDTSIWHHYALVWDKNGIEGLGDGTKKVALYLDGVLNTGRWINYYPTDSEIVPLKEGSLKLLDTNFTEGSVTFDNIKIYNYAKNDFEDRNVE